MDRTEATLVSHIQEWVEQGTTIVSDCWKGYVNLKKYGYEHKIVNHSVEFVSPEGYDTNKIEGHWRQMKVSVPTHGRKKEQGTLLFISCRIYLALHQQWEGLVLCVFKGRCKCLSI